MPETRQGRRAAKRRRWSGLRALGALCALGAGSGAPLWAQAGLVLAPPSSTGMPQGQLVMQGAAPVSAQGAARTAPLSRGCGNLRLTGGVAPSAHNLVPGENRRYDALIEQVARSHGHDTALIRAIVQVESAFNPQAISPKGAMGLMQVMPSTAQAMGIRNASRLLQPAVNLEAGARLLRELLDHFNGSLELALAAYNAGETAVRRWGGIPPYAETQTYVDLVLQAYAQFGRRPLNSGCQTTAAD